LCAAEKWVALDAGYQLLKARKSSSKRPINASEAVLSGR
jgi:hypothetical protein